MEYIVKLKSGGEIKGRAHKYFIDPPSNTIHFYNELQRKTEVMSDGVRKSLMLNWETNMIHIINLDSVEFIEFTDGRLPEVAEG